MSSRIVPAESRVGKDNIPEICIKDESFVPQTNTIKVLSKKYTKSALEEHIEEVLKRNGGVSFKFCKAPPTTWRCNAPICRPKLMTDFMRP